MPRLTIDRDQCMRTGQCYTRYPELLQPDDDDMPVPVRDRFDEAERAKLEDVAGLCPTGAIALVEDEEPA
jgi:ferredoxin